MSRPPGRNGAKLEQRKARSRPLRRRASLACARSGRVASQVSVHEANGVTKDFLLLSQPFINAGILIASASSGRRLYIHHLTEVPLNEVYLTRTGNHLQRVDQAHRAAACVCQRFHSLASAAGRAPRVLPGPCRHRLHCRARHRCPPRHPGANPPTCLPLRRRELST